MSTTGYAYAPAMLNYNPLHCFPSAEDLPDSDDEPVDNQLQHLIPGLLEANTLGLRIFWRTIDL
ncbi:hypothetical protein FACHB389_11885 [Nostoc calcicola FACHB-389]|nr:hypothetical protein [Nostoc calcicola FACHB-3891]MDZ8063456.1 hypothetical protein [Nostoc sp. EkiNYC01]OKH35760.1 hypothetical protein FACHB389_11885 [Nostoc calcicola FACHB-389]